jgi:hypothetical protein
MIPAYPLQWPAGGPRTPERCCPSAATASIGAHCAHRKSRHRQYELVMGKRPRASGAARFLNQEWNSDGKF